MFRSFVIVLLAFVFGAGATYIVVVGGTLLAWDLLGVHDRDGGGAMAIGLVIGPICAVVGGVASGVFALVRTSRRKNQDPTPTALESRRDRNRLLVLAAAIIGGLVGRKVTQAVFWLVAPLSYDAYWKVQVIIWSPTVMMVLCALGAGYLAHRLTQGQDAPAQTPPGQ